MFASSSKIEFQHNINSLFYLENISVDYGNIKALQSLSLTIEKGEIIFITGASGAGKTTLLNILSKIEVGYKGRVINNNPVFISTVCQNLRLLENKTCRDNLMISFDPAFYESKKTFIADLNELSEIFNITDRLDIKANNANGGLRQKIAIIRALLTRPEVFIADEPTSSLDYDNAYKLYEVLNLYNAKRGMTVIWASHNRELVKKFTGRVIHLDKGKLVYSGNACFI